MPAADRDAPAPFSFAENRDGVVTIFRIGRAVTTLRGTAASRFLARIAGRDEAGVQREMARVTGNYRRGNERAARARETDKA